MLIEHKKFPLHWGTLDLALLALENDWHGNLLDVPAAFGLATDHARLWFVATRHKPATSHPQARPGEFTPGLWKYDVAEFFLSHPASGRYLEFTAPRVRVEEENVPLPGVKTYANLAPDGTWLAAASIPLDVLQTRFGFGLETHMNVTFIVDSPAQKFLTASPVQNGQPDFHRPELFKQVIIRDSGLPWPSFSPLPSHTGFIANA